MYYMPNLEGDDDKRLADDANGGPFAAFDFIEAHDKNQIELRNVNYEGDCPTNAASRFSAEVWIDGKQEGNAVNEGSGALTLVTPKALHDRLTAYGETLTGVEVEGAPSWIMYPPAEYLADVALRIWICDRLFDGVG